MLKGSVLLEENRPGKFLGHNHISSMSLYVMPVRLLFHVRTTAVSTSGAAVRCCPSPQNQSLDLHVMDVEEEVLTLALLHKTIYKKVNEFSINFLQNISHA
jgi:hypothetical protein